MDDFLPQARINNLSGCCFNFQKYYNLCDIEMSVNGWDFAQETQNSIKKDVFSATKLYKR